MQLVRGCMDRVPRHAALARFQDFAKFPLNFRPSPTPIARLIYGRQNRVNAVSDCDRVRRQRLVHEDSYCAAVRTRWSCSVTRRDVDVGAVPPACVAGDANRVRIIGHAWQNLCDADDHVAATVLPLGEAEGQSCRRGWAAVRSARRGSAWPNSGPNVAAIAHGGARSAPRTRSSVKFAAVCGRSSSDVVSSARSTEPKVRGSNPLGRVVRKDLETKLFQVGTAGHKISWSRVLVPMHSRGAEGEYAEAVGVEPGTDGQRQGIFRWSAVPNSLSTPSTGRQPRPHSCRRPGASLG